MSTTTPPTRGSDFRKLWTLDPAVTFLNHGSFGACPRAVLEEQSRFRAQLEAEPVRFMMIELLPLFDRARSALAKFVGAHDRDIVFVPNATVGVNTALRNLPIEAGDEILVTDQEYPASRNSLDFIAERRGAVVVPVPIPFPSEGEAQVLERVMDAVTPRTRFALLDHITSQTGLILPIEALIRRLADKGIETIVDGAHAVGMVPLQLAELGAAYFTSNCHKWLCTPKGSAFLYIRPDLQSSTRPLALSHGATQTWEGRPRHWLEFDWLGTSDPTAFLTIPKAIEYLGSLLPGGWDEIRTRNRELALQSRRVLCDGLGIDVPSPDSMVGALAGAPLPPGSGPAPGPPTFFDPLAVALSKDFGITVPITNWPNWPDRVIRTSSQLYNQIEDTERLVSALKVLLAKE